MGAERFSEQILSNSKIFANGFKLNEAVGRKILQNALSIGGATSLSDHLIVLKAGMFAIQTAVKIIVVIANIAILSVIAALSRSQSSCSKYQNDLAKVYLPYVTLVLLSTIQAAVVVLIPK